jgi:hypothetical protein
MRCLRLILRLSSESHFRRRTRIPKSTLARFLWFAAAEVLTSLGFPRLAKYVWNENAGEKRKRSRDSNSIHKSVVPVAGGGGGVLRATIDNGDCLSSKPFPWD